nr:hypothetical protein [Persicitalea jodogahamensis]
MLITFCFCGLLHDLVTLLVRGSTSFLFTIWFILMGAGVLITRLLNHDFSEKKWVVRALINASIIICCFILSTCLINLFGTLNSNGVR